MQKSCGAPDVEDNPRGRRLATVALGNQEDVGSKRWLPTEAEGGECKGGYNGWYC